MFRKMLMTLGATAGLLVPAVMPTEAEAAPPGVSIGIGIGRPAYYPPTYVSPTYYTPSFYPPVVHGHYDVLYRTCAHDPWRVYGTYHSHHRAHEVEDYLEARGYDARVSHR